MDGEVYDVWEEAYAERKVCVEWAHNECLGMQFESVRQDLGPAVFKMKSYNYSLISN